MRPTVLISEPLDAAPLAWLAERATVHVTATDHPDFPAHLAAADALIVRTYTRVDAALLALAPRLRVVGRAGVGLDNIDLAATTARGIRVVNTPDANTLAVGDFVVSLLVRLIRPWHFMTAPLPSPAEFKRLRAPTPAPARQLDELTVGILGMGRVGRRVGRALSRGFGTRIVYCDLLDVAPLLDFLATALPMHDLLAAADALSIHVDYRPANHHLVGAVQLAQLPAGAVVINTSRGEVLDAAALARELSTPGRLAAAAVDVYDPEPPPPDHPLAGLPNCLLTPHLASRTTTALANMSWVVRDVLAALT